MYMYSAAIVMAIMAVMTVKSCYLHTWNNMLFSCVKISCLCAKAHLVFHWCLYNKRMFATCYPWYVTMRRVKLPLTHIWLSLSRLWTIMLVHCRLHLWSPVAHLFNIHLCELGEVHEVWTRGSTWTIRICPASVQVSDVNLHTVPI